MLPARYLVRFDDICPTMNWDIWQQVERSLNAHGVRPIVAVVPDNRDPQLRVAPRRPDFWAKVREWQARGWTIGLHGYQHLYTTKNAGILGRNHYSEFAGLPAYIQRSRLRAGVSIFRGNGVRADCFVAPAHSFDEATLDALVDVGVPAISDGYALAPYRCQRGLLWVPQQMGRFRRIPFGTWTICQHTNSWTKADCDTFDAFLCTFDSQMTTFEALCAQFGARKPSWADQFAFRSLRAARGWRS
jgi:predicted deacetylase